VIPYLSAQPAVSITGCVSDRPDWPEINLEFESFHEARRHILGLGRAIEVLAPEPLRRSVIDFARQVIDLYHSTIP
jgi:predicted DNA-binding transcriptional regulator YafY